MKNKLHNIPVIIIALTLIIAFGQQTEAQNENKFIRRGNNAYADQDFKKAEIDYRKALEKNQNSAKGEFNLGTSLYQQKGYEESAKIYEKLAGTLQTPEARAGAYHNLGNSLVQSQQYQPAIEAYKNALRLNPNDLDTKYNLEYARRMLQQQQDQQEDQNKKDDQQKDQNKNNDQQKDQDKQDDQQKQDQQQQQDQKQKDQQQQNQQQQSQGDQQQQPDGQAQPKQISKEDAERMLQALKDNEKKTLEKLKLEKLKSAKRVKSEKDW
jgi:tetratricopeptide (TPR) repeat protein